MGLRRSFNTANLQAEKEANDGIGPSLKFGRRRNMTLRGNDAPTVELNKADNMDCDSCNGQLVRRYGRGFFECYLVVTWSFPPEL